MKGAKMIDLLFETSWEICNKVGGIHTVISTKALNIVNELDDNYILIGPDVWRDEGENPEFIPDNSLFSDWKDKAASEGLRVRSGRWNIPAKPVVLLVDFTPYFNEKNEIFARLWEQYKLDSLSGEWDYIEPALFGYAAGKVVESFTGFYNGYQDIVAQFHEWMTGVGVLYLKENAPWVSTSFTTHATVLGRTIAGNNRPLYSKLESYNPQQVAREFNVVAKRSLEKTAAHASDVFTTVSEITSKECSAFLEKDVDIVTPNGFEDNFVPGEGEYGDKRKEAREILLNAAGIISGRDLADDSMLVVTSGRYEYHNKGIDIFIEALAKADREIKPGRNIVAFIMVPAYHKGPRKDIADYLSGVSGDIPGGENILSHGLHNPGTDPVMNALESNKLRNTDDNNVICIFVPSYLNGNDGIFNRSYYDLLIGFDLTVFPSYYEPWGYTPLESLMFSIPTVTTTLAGFGLWVRNHHPGHGDGICVVERDDFNREQVANEISEYILRLYGLDKVQTGKIREEAFSISRIANWNKLVDHYFEAYEIALERSKKRRDEPRELSAVLLRKDIIARKPHEVPVWKDIYIQSDLPERLSVLKELSCNMWWSWNHEAQNVFRRIDPSLWEETDHNPCQLLERVDYKRLKVLAEDEEYIADLENVYSEYRTYMDRPYSENTPLVAYFSMEFGIHHSLKTYSGGLGVLAGDYLKEASDSNYNIVGVGLLYRFGYFRQQIGPKGQQMAISEAEDFSQLAVSPVEDEEGKQMKISLVWPGRTVKARIWEAKVGKVRLLLLDTDFDENSNEDRQVTHHLYGGDHENRLKQELLLGIGGIRALRTLGIKPDIYHSNEGHSAFIGLERMRYLMEKRHLTFEEGLEAIRASTLFTTHTPVPAGHDSFDEGLLRKYIPHYPERLKITWERLISLGRAYNDTSGKFNMSYLAARMSQEINGVSKLHGEVSRRMLNVLWPGYLEEELFIGHVTNGVHYPTWLNKQWKKLYRELTGEKNFDQTDKSRWEIIYSVPDKDIYEIKTLLKQNLFEWIRKRIQTEMMNKRVSPRRLINISNHLNPDALTIGFARRFATYKRATLLFKDLDRLNEIINDPDKPVQFIFAGKAHPHDGGGQSLIERIIEVSHMPQFEGKIIFLENYDMEMSKQLISGVDIWLNTPTRPLEASGTSGEKAVMNGTIHFSVLDGWWVEGYRAYAGFALPLKRTFANQELQDDVDAETIYNMLEYEIIPAYYDRDDHGVPVEWISYIKNSMVQVAPQFTMKRMIDDYYESYYMRLWERSKLLKENNYARAIALSAWKRWMENEWDKLEILTYSFEKPGENIYKAGVTYKGEVMLNVNGIPPENVGVEFIITQMTQSGDYQFISKYDLEYISSKNGRSLYRLEMVPEKAGTFFYGLRLYPKNDDLPHRQDFYLLKWID
ncbi:MAG: alpha-glucan family phosphorylase [Bacteroidales bacterium]|jgi:phosphorylase/glycogen(starch) synthase|nr:alpha-glucan family phosphorylase [Bacteroidales bacterium]